MFGPPESRLWQDWHLVATCLPAAMSALGSSVPQSIGASTAAASPPASAATWIA